MSGNGRGMCFQKRCLLNELCPAFKWNATDAASALNIQRGGGLLIKLRPGLSNNSCPEMWFGRLQCFTGLVNHQLGEHPWPFLIPLRVDRTTGRAGLQPA
jgi:hypothetical protein